MGLRTEWEKKIEKKRQEIATWEAQIKEANAYIQGVMDVIRSLPREGAEEEKSTEFALRPGSDMAKARDLIRRTGKPLHISDILKGIGKDVTPANIKSVSGSMNNYIRDGKIFTRPRTRTYGLIELELVGISSVSSEPPEDFGIGKQAEMSMDEEDSDQPF